MMMANGMAVGMTSGMARGAGRMGLGFIGGPWGMLVQVGVILLVIAIVYFVVRNHKKKASEKAVMEPLKMKYVEGEITEEEYKKRKAVVLGK